MRLQLQVQVLWVVLLRARGKGYAFEILGALCVFSWFIAGLY